MTGFAPHFTKSCLIKKSPRLPTATLSTHSPWIIAPSPESREAGMQNSTIIEFARQLLVVHGAKASEEAAVHERICTKYGAERTAETWRSVQTALADLKSKKGSCLH